MLNSFILILRLFGRLTKRTEPDLVSSWVYDTATGGLKGSCIGRLSTATATGVTTRVVRTCPFSSDTVTLHSIASPGILGIECTGTVIPGTVIPA